MSRDTSIAAANAVADSASQMRARCFVEIKNRGGATCDELEMVLDLKHQTASARLNELATAGMIIDSSARRMTRSGCKAIVWVEPPPQLPPITESESVEAIRIKTEQEVVHGDCLEKLKKLRDNCIDSVVSDPPYELGFMGKKWDASGIAYSVELWREVLRVLKPGGHLLAFGGTRTYHRMTCAIEDAGFEIRDSIDWIYGTGFPKSLDVSKAIQAGGGPESIRRLQMGDAYEPSGRGRINYDHGGGSAMNGSIGSVDLSDAAKQWAGWGTALKPAHEPIVMARKPLIGTVAANVQTHGTGAINIDACRIAHASAADLAESLAKNPGRDGETVTSDVYGANRPQQSVNAAGRWPANVLFDENAASEIGDSARFFYVAKPSRKERDLGCEALPARTAGEATDREDGSDGLKSPRAGAGRTGGSKNFHPTVKPIELMRYLIRLVTPLNGIVLDPFGGSGTTGCAAALENFNCLLFERDLEYVEIARARIAHCSSMKETK